MVMWNTVEDKHGLGLESQRKIDFYISEFIVVIAAAGCVSVYDYHKLDSESNWSVFYTLEWLSSVNN